MKIILNSLKNTFQDIRKSKRLSIFLFFTQLLFIILIASVFLFYAIQMGEGAQVLMDSFQNSQMGEFGVPSTEGLAEAAEQFSQSKNMFFIVTFLLYIILNGINWNLSNLITEGENKFPRYPIYFALLTLIFLIPAYFLNDLFLRLFSAQTLLVTSIIIIITLYFMYISFALINHYKLKELLKQTFILGIKKAKIIIPTYLIISLLIFIPLYLMQKSIEGNFLLTGAYVILFILILIWNRIFFLEVIKKF